MFLLRALLLTLLRTELLILCYTSASERVPSLLFDTWTHLYIAIEKLQLSLTTIAYSEHRAPRDHDCYGVTIHELLLLWLLLQSRALLPQLLVSLPGNGMIIFAAIVGPNLESCELQGLCDGI